MRTIGRPEIEDGRIVRVGGNIVDVTARKRAEEQLRHERDLYNATLDVAGAVIVVLDADGRLLRFNRQAELLTGYREAEVLGRDPYRVPDPARRSARRWPPTWSRCRPDQLGPPGKPLDDTGTVGGG